MSIRAVLCINRREYRVLRYRQRFARRVSSNGMPASDLYGGTIDVEFESERDSGMFALMTDENTPTIEGYLRISPSEEDTMVRELKFDEAYLVGYSEQQYDDWGAPVTMCVSISPIRLDFNRTVCIERRNSSIWREYRAEKPLFKAPVHTPPSPLVTSVKGEETALPTHTVKYTVTGYNLATIGTNDRERVKWLVRVDGRDELLSQRGETLELTIKPEWTGKDVTVMPYLRKPNEEVSVKTTVIFEPHIRIILTNIITGYTIQALKGIDFYTSDPAVIVPTYRVNVVNYDETCKEGIVEFSFDVTRDAWYCIGKKNGKYKIINRAFVPANWKQNLYGAFWVPSYPRFSKLGAFVLTRFGKKELPAQPLLTQKCLDGKYIDSPRKDERIATDVMIHIGGTYEVLGYDHLGGSYGCFGFIPKEDIYKTPEEAGKASLNDDYDDQTSNSEWIKVTNKILRLSFSRKKNIKVLIEYRDEKTNYTPQIIYNE